MARIVVTSSGYWGDIAPFAALAIGLAQRHHSVVLLVRPEFHQLLKSERLTVLNLGPSSGRDFFQIHEDSLGNRGAWLDGVVMIRRVIRTDVLDRLDWTFDALMGATQGADAIVTHAMVPLARAVAELRGIPWVIGQLMPTLIPSSRVPPPVVGRIIGLSSETRLRNSALWKVVEPTVGIAMKDFAINRFRRSLGLRPVRGTFSSGSVSSDLTLVPLPKTFVGDPGAWPPSVRFPGFVTWNSGDRGLPDEMKRYLDAGPAPVVVTLGTTMATNPGSFFDRAAATLDALGLRSIFVVGHDSNIRGALKDRPGVWGFAPLAPLFRFARAVIHPGSHGMVAETLLAGVPSIVVPTLFDAHWRARRIEALGLGVYLKKASARRLQQALEQVVGDGGMRARTAAFASSLSHEDSLGAACELIEGVLAGRPS